jgi:hypothetical protein
MLHGCFLGGRLRVRTRKQANMYNLKETTKQPKNINYICLSNLGRAPTSCQSSYSTFGCTARAWTVMYCLTANNRSCHGITCEHSQCHIVVIYNNQWQLIIVITCYHNITLDNSYSCSPSEHLGRVAGIWDTSLHHLCKPLFITVHGGQTCLAEPERQAIAAIANYKNKSDQVSGGIMNR